MSSHTYSGSLHPHRHGEYSTSSVIKKTPKQNLRPHLPPIDNNENEDQNDPEIVEDDEITERISEEEIEEEEEEEIEEEENDEINDNNGDDDDNEDNEDNEDDIEEEDNENENDENFSPIKERMGELKKKHIREIDGMCKDMNQSTQDFEDERDSVVEKVTKTDELNFSMTDSLSGSISPIELLGAQLKLETQKSEKLEQMLAEERERIANLEEMLHEELQKNDKLNDEITQAKNEISKANDTIADLKEKLDKNDLKNGIGVLREENSSLMDQIEELQAELNKKHKQRDTEALESELKQSKEVIAIKDSKIEQLNSKNNDLLQQIEELNNRLKCKQTPQNSTQAGNIEKKAPNSRIPKTRPPRTVDGDGGYDPKRFGFKLRPTSAEEHLLPSSSAVAARAGVSRFPSSKQKDKHCSDDDVHSLAEIERPRVKKPKTKEDDPSSSNSASSSNAATKHNSQSKETNPEQQSSGGIVKRPKLGALKEPTENDTEYIDDKLPIKVNKVDVSFSGEPINKEDEKKTVEPSRTKQPQQPPPRRAMMDNIKFGCDDDENGEGPKFARNQVKNNKEKNAAVVDNIKFDSNENGANERPQPLKPIKTAMESHITFDHEDAKPVHVRPPPQSSNGNSSDCNNNVSGIDRNELQSRVDKLNFEKAEIERQLSKALPKVKVMAPILKEREELESHLEEVVKEVSKIKLELHFAERKK